MKVSSKAAEGHSGVLIFAEQEDGEIHSVSFELLGKGRELADKLGVELTAVILGHEVKKLDELVYHGADKVLLVDSPLLGEFDVVRYKKVLVDLLKEVNPEIFLLGATLLGRSLGPRVAAALNTGLTADCTDLYIDQSGNFIQMRPAFSGNIFAHIKTRTRPQMATVRYKVMKKIDRDISRQGKVIRKNCEIPKDTGIRILSREKGDEVDIAEAKVIVCAGKGLKKPEDFAQLRALSDLLGGVVGASRPLVDAGWISKEHQVGFSGNTVKPHVYFACGVSGAPQHLAGMRDSEIIIAINNDPSAQIFKTADYGIVGDIYKVLPRLIDALKEKRAREIHV